jgi:DNA-binding CsgD family transcriptional regulator
MGQVERATLGALQVAVAALSSAEVFDNLEPVLAALMIAMDADLGGYYLHDALGLSWPVLILPADGWRALPETHRCPLPTREGARIHPGWDHCLRSRAEPFAVSDIVSERAWHSCEAARLMRPHWGRQYQFAIPIYSPTNPTTFAAWVFARSGHDFTARHHRVAELVRPVLTQVTRHHTAALQAGAQPRGPTPALTDRERAILPLLARGQTATHIARQLSISPRTVQKHVEHVYRKLGVHDRQGALQRAVTLGAFETAESYQPRR